MGHIGPLWKIMPARAYKIQSELTSYLYLYLYQYIYLVNYINIFIRALCTNFLFNKIGEN